MTNIKERGHVPHVHKYNNRKIKGKNTMKNTSKFTKIQLATLNKVHASLDAVKALSESDNMKKFLVNFVSKCEEYALTGNLDEDNEYILTLIFKKYVLKKAIFKNYEVCVRLYDILDYKYISLTNSTERYLRELENYAPPLIINNEKKIMKTHTSTVRIIHYFINLYIKGEMTPEQRLLVALFGEKTN